MKMHAITGTLIVVAGVAIAPLAAQGVSAPETAASALPQGEGRELVAAACTQCHTLTPIIGMRDGPVGWRRHVENMVLRGARLDDRQIEKLLSYLDTNFGPGQALPPAKPVDLPDGSGRELVESRCTLCHDLERVTIIKRRRQNWPVIVDDMYDRFGLSEPGEQAQIVQYLSTHYSSE